MSKRLLNIILISTLLCGLTNNAISWNENTHKNQLTKTALELLRILYENNKEYPSEIWSIYGTYIMQGSWDEDFPCSYPYITWGDRKIAIKMDLRANNHYRHALSGSGLSCSPLDMGDFDHDALTWAKTNPSFNPDEEFKNGTQWEGVSKYLWFTPNDLDFGNMSWENAINRYGYTESSKKLAYYTLGFILHLLQDMGCPEHVHDDPHGASSYSGFERWVEDYFYRLWEGTKIARPKRFSEPEKIDDFFINLSKIAYSANRFHGDWGGDMEFFYEHSNLAKMFRIVQERRIMPDLTGRLQWELLGKGGPPDQDINFRLKDFIENPSSHKKGDGGWWPTYLEAPLFGHKIQDKSRYFYIELSDDIPPGYQRKLYPHAFLPTPLDDVLNQCSGPEWHIENLYPHGKDLNWNKHLYTLIGRCVIPATIEHTAGFIEYYYDIVNHPPYVKQLSISQDDDLKYSAWWVDNEKIAPNKDHVTHVENRNLHLDKDKPLKPGPMIISVVFSEPVKEVKVSLGNEIIKGSLQDQDIIWRASFEIPEDNYISGYQKISITAIDKDNHFMNEKGLLDKYPRTPAKRRYSARAWPTWKDYEPGKDENHRVNIVIKGKKIKTTETKESPRREPVIFGKWLWFNRAEVTISPGGKMTATLNGKYFNHGNWRVIDRVRREYVLEWEVGGWKDTLILSADGMTLSGKNQRGGGVAATKILR